MTEYMIISLMDYSTKPSSLRDSYFPRSQKTDGIHGNGNLKGKNTIWNGF